MNIHIVTLLIVMRLHFICCSMNRLDADLRNQFTDQEGVGKVEKITDASKVERKKEKSR